MTDHPLFPPLNDDEDAPEVTQIHVTRFEGGRPVYCPRLFGADELLTLEQVSDMFGGGDYELIARNGKTFSARRRYTLPGRPRLLTLNDVPTEPTGMPQQVQMPPSSGSDMMQFLALMTQQSSQMMALIMQQSQTSMQTMATIITAALGGKGDGSALIQALQSNNDRALTGQAELFKAIIQTNGASNGGAVQALKEGIAMGQQLKTENGGTGEGDSLGDTLGQVLEGLQYADKLSGGGGHEEIEVSP